jgi:hypothetical protein
VPIALIHSGHVFAYITEVLRAASDDLDNKQDVQEAMAIK